MEPTMNAPSNDQSVFVLALSKGHLHTGVGTVLQQMMVGTGCGILYGITSPLVGHPIDTVKTKMQAQGAYFRGSAFTTMRNVVRNEGFLALYKGLGPPLVGSSMFRAIQFGAYGASYAMLDKVPGMTTPIPGTGGLQPRVIFAGIVASTARALLETPLEFIKVRKQTGQQWRLAATWQEAVRQPIPEIRNLFSGFSVTWLRTMGLMTSFFIMVDSGLRHYPDVLNAPVYGPFIKGGVIATIAWWIVWPFENLKNQVQAGTEGVAKDASWVTRAQYILKHRGGIVGLYRGIGPGSARSLIANGISMIVLTACLDTFREHLSEK